MSDNNDRTFENNGRQVQEDLIDPGPIPGVGARGTYRRQLERALATKTTSMRKGVPSR